MPALVRSTTDSACRGRDIACYCLTPACTGSQSVGERTVNQLLDQLAIVGTDRARRLAHVDSGEFKATVVRDNMRVPSSWPPLSNICEKRR